MAKSSKTFPKEEGENHRETIQLLRADVLALKKKLRIANRKIKSLEHAFDQGILNINELIENRPVEDLIVKDTAVRRHKHKLDKKDKVTVDAQVGEETVEDIRKRFRRQYSQSKE